MKRFFMFFVFVFVVSLACEVRPDHGETITPTFTSTATPTSTATATPTNTSTPTATSTATSTATPTPIPCFSLLSPQDGSEFRDQGLIVFEWEEQPGVSSYLLTILLPNGYAAEREEKVLTTTSYERWLESLPLAGDYRWSVSAIDESGNPFCATDFFGFSKTQYDPTPEPEVENGNNDSEVEDDPID